MRSTLLLFHLLLKSFVSIEDVRLDRFAVQLFFEFFALTFLLFGLEKFAGCLHGFGACQVGACDATRIPHHS